MNVYFDNASTTWPKPSHVAEAICECMQYLRGSPGRSGGIGPLAHLIPETRAKIARMFNIRDPGRIALAFNATAALNLGIQGFLQRGDRAVTTSMEHNAVCRPLHVLKKYRGLEFEMVRSTPDGYVDLDGLHQALSKPTRLLIVNHASNVTGAVNPLEAIGRLAKEHGAAFMVDASQTAGIVHIDVERDQVDMLAAPGHKGLLGPTGTGFCYIAPSVEVRPVLFGGTGNVSELEFMPDEGPERFEPGTLNFHGLAGLSAALDYLEQRGLAEVERRETEIAQRTLDGLRTISGLTLHGPATGGQRLPVFSLTCPNREAAVLSRALSELDIVHRTGLHCAPWAHQTLGTFPGGTVRVSPGLFHTEEEVDFLLGALDRAAHRSAQK